jgi:hypothetical protein
MKTRDGIKIRKRMTVYSIYEPQTPLKVIDYCSTIKWITVKKEGRKTPIIADAILFCKDQVMAAKENLPMLIDSVKKAEKELKGKIKEVEKLKKLLKKAEENESKT